MKTCFTVSTGETVTRVDHPSGLTVYIYPKEGFRGAYALFGTKYGSVDTAFEVDGKTVEVPAGIAHYLEHKLFESEDMHAFERYAKTGANANAYTSFDQTAYHFSCSDHFEESLEILLDFVQTPYFTEKTVQKEQGIIGQEIRMRDDEPDWRVLYNLLTVLYADNPVRIDIAGTVESISHITPQLLYDCYHTFYNLRNMALVTAGNVTVEQVLSVCDRMLKPAPPLNLTHPLPREREDVEQTYIEQVMPVSSPLFYVGYKCPIKTLLQPTKTLAAAGIAVMLLSAESSDLFASLMEKGLINDQMESEFFEGRGYALFLFGGESRDPRAAADLLQKEIRKFREDGIDAERFEECRAAMYGRLLSRTDSIEGCVAGLWDDFLYGRDPGELTQAVSSLQVSDVQEIFERWLRPEQFALSVVRGE